MPAALTLHGTPDAPSGDAPGRAARWAGVLLFATALGALALVRDEAFLRTKVVAGETWLLGAASVLLGVFAVAGRARLPAPHVLGCAFLPAAVAGAWFLIGKSESRTLALDELERLILLPVALATGALAGGEARARRLLLATLILTAIPVTAQAVAQHLAALLDLPMARVERPAATFGNPVFLGAWLVLVTPLALAGALLGRGVLRWGGAVAAGLALPALYATQTRWAWLGFGGAAALGVLLLATSAAWRRALLAAIVVAGGVLAVANLAVLQRASAHGLIWRDTWRLVAEHPLGVGPGQYPVAFLPYASPELLAIYPRQLTIVNDAHSEPLQVLAELGWPGLLAAALALLVLGRAALRAQRTAAPEERALAAGLLAGLAGMLLMSCGSPDERFFASPMLFGSCAGLLLAMGPARSVQPGAPARALLALSAAALAGLAWRTAAEGLEVRELLSAPPSLAAAPDGSAEIARLWARVEAAPLDAAARFDLGVALAGERRWVESADALQAASRLAGDTAGLQRTLGLVQAMAGRTDEAVPNLQAALAQRPDDGEVRYMLAYIAFSRGDVATALQDVETLLAQHPDHALGKLLERKLRE
ncbi:MAG TPA: O-antigen ligase family protein [Planctomycetota bacterium]|nr:O-antigen ligase family protein [Planctomycetota bacterium]